MTSSRWVGPKGQAPLPMGAPALRCMRRSIYLIRRTSGVEPFHLLSIQFDTPLCPHSPGPNLLPNTNPPSASFIPEIPSDATLHPWLSLVGYRLHVVYFILFCLASVCLAESYPRILARRPILVATGPLRHPTFHHTYRTRNGSARFRIIRVSLPQCLPKQSIIL